MYSSTGFHKLNTPCYRHQMRKVQGKHWRLQWGLFRCLCLDSEAGGGGVVSRGLGEERVSGGGSDFCLSPQGARLWEGKAAGVTSAPDRLVIAPAYRQNKN